MLSDAEHILGLLEPILKAETAEAAVRAAASGLGGATGSAVTGFVVAMPGGIFLESWHPENNVRWGDSIHHLRRIAVETAEAGAARAAVVIETAGSQLVVRALHLPLPERLSGVLCLASTLDEAPALYLRGASVSRIARLVGLRLGALLQVEAERRRSDQFERWFRVSDKHVRALDRERQKFVALVNAIATGAFVVDRARIIQWHSRQLLERLPQGGAAVSWNGRCCEEFCRSVGGGKGLACSDCPAARVLEFGQIAHAGGRVVLADGERIMNVTAVPISDLEGRTEEVMVTFQDHALFEQRAA